jgi:hypothetical protein
LGKGCSGVTRIIKVSCLLRGVLRFAGLQHKSTSVDLVCPQKRSGRIEIINVGSLSLLSFPLPYFPPSLPYLGTLLSCFQTRAAMPLKILPLHHPINVPRGSQRGRVRLREVDRVWWAGRLHPRSGWGSALIIAKPERSLPGIAGEHDRGSNLQRPHRKLSGSHPKRRGDCEDCPHGENPG